MDGRSPVKRRTARYREQKRDLIKRKQEHIKRLARIRVRNYRRWDDSQMERIL